MRKAKSKFARLGALAVATVMATGVGVTSLAAFADDTTDVASLYHSLEEVLNAERELNKEIAGEGVVLMKNKNNALPLATGAKVTLLGGNAYQAQTGGGGSGGLSTPYGVDTTKEPSTTLRAGLHGLKVNPTVAALYGTGSSANGENKTYMSLLEDGTGAVAFGGKQYNASEDSFLKNVENTYSEYGDAAIISVMRSGSEFVDNSTHDRDQHADVDEHYMTLNDNERQLFAYAKHQKAQGKLKKIIVVLNTPSNMEVADLEEDDAIDAILEIGTTGWNGMDVMGDILTGKVNPSGKTVDFWMKDLGTDPTTYNLSDYSYAHHILYGTYDNYNGDTGAPTPQARGGNKNKGVGSSPTMGHIEGTEYASSTNHAIHYAEGIYMCYR